MTLYWYKSQNPIEPYVFNDTAKALVGYKTEQDYPSHAYVGKGTYDQVKDKRLKQHFQNKIR